MRPRARAAGLRTALVAAALAGCGGVAPPAPTPRADSVQADGTLLDLADEALRQGDVAGARRHLEQVLEADRSNVGAHARLATLTGSAPAAPASSLAQALESADAHPYDPRAVLQAGRLLAESGQAGTAGLYLERVLWLADLDPGSAEQAARLQEEAGALGYLED